MGWLDGCMYELVVMCIIFLWVSVDFVMTVGMCVFMGYGDIVGLDHHQSIAIQIQLNESNRHANKGIYQFIHRC
jgi:hypothetical protein